MEESDDLRSDEECVRNGNALSCPLVEDGTATICLGLDNGTAAAFTSGGSRPAKHVELGGGLPEREQCSSLEEWTMDEIVIRIGVTWIGLYRRLEDS